jgi:Mn2+/Fe2+ NRAMP family transporter
LARPPLQAKAFYAAIAAATFLGAMANVVGLNPVTALVWAAVINGVVAVPMMALLLLMGANTKIMGEFRTSNLWNFVGWIATLMMAGVTGVFVITTLLH